MMELKLYTDLPEDARQIREEVFVREQGFQDEFDDRDHHCTHLVLYDQGKPVATSRFFPSENGKEYVIGRLALLKPYRRKNLGSEMLRMTESEIKKLGGLSTVLHAQVRASRFYEKQGYLAYGDIDYEEDCPHIWMKKDLLKAEGD